MGNFSFTELGKDFSVQNQKFNFCTSASNDSKTLNVKNIDIFGENLQTSFNNSSVKDKAASIFSTAIENKNSNPKVAVEADEQEKTNDKTTIKGYGITSVETNEAPGGYKEVCTVKNAGTLKRDVKKVVVLDKNGKTAFTVRCNGGTKSYEDRNGNTLYSIESNNGIQTLKNASGKVMYTCISEYDPEKGETKLIYKDANGKVITAEQAHKLENSLRSKEMRDYSKCHCEAFKAMGGECMENSDWFPLIF